MSDCLFCGMVEREVDADIVHETDELMAFRDINPQAPTHILIIPKAHIASINHMGSEHAELVGKLFTTARDLARQEGITDSGFRVVMNCGSGAGQTVFHMHLHLLGGRAMEWPPG